MCYNLISFGSLAVTRHIQLRMWETCGKSAMAIVKRKQQSIRALNTRDT